MNHKRAVVLRAAALAALAVPALAVPARAAMSAQAASANATVFVSAQGKAGAPDSGCRSAAFTSIGAGVAAVAAGGKVVVCAGRYHEDVAVTRPLALLGRPGAVIDAAGQVNGVLVRASHVTVRGFTVTRAIGEGILVLSASHATIADNVVVRDDLGGMPHAAKNTYPECQAQHSIPGDCGEGIHLMGSSYSVVQGNVSVGNTGGILLSDETGPTAHNLIEGNMVASNLFDCGITVVGHNPKAAPGGVPAPETAGVYANRIAGNTISGNGTTGQGAGVVLATGLPGGAVYDNTVTGNSINGNGISGVTVHSHVPGEYLDGNVITRNKIGVNNLDGDADFAPHVDRRTTGVLVATVGSLTVRVAGNLIVDDHFGIWTTGPVTVRGAHRNTFAAVAVPVARG